MPVYTSAVTFSHATINRGDASWSSIHGDCCIIVYHKMNATSSPIPNDSSSAASIGATGDLDSLGCATINCSCAVIGTSINITSDTVKICGDGNNFDYVHRGLNDFSVNFWRKKGSTAGDLTMLSNKQGCCVCKGFGWRQDTPSYKSQFFVSTGVAVNSLCISSFIPSCTTCWNMYTATYDVSTGNGSFWINGACKTNVCGTAVSSGCTAAGCLHYGSLKGFSSFDCARYDEATFFKGKLLSCTEVTDFYNSGAGREVY